ncbi:MAG: YecH family protein [Lacunisphaera sp.]|nr:YecH family protein [Lacunisphaera sp.]
MPKQIHGHDVLDMMLASQEVYTRDSLRTAMSAKFGSDARYRACSAENMNAATLIDFLAKRGKFTEQPGGFTLDPGKVCQH